MGTRQDIDNLTICQASLVELTVDVPPTVYANDQ
jgi:hypothetical protein